MEKPQRPTEVDLLMYLEGELDEKECSRIKALLDVDWDLRSQLNNIKNDLDTYLEATTYQSPPAIPSEDEAWQDFLFRSSKIKVNTINDIQLFKDFYGQSNRILQFLFRGERKVFISIAAILTLSSIIWLMFSHSVPTTVTATEVLSKAITAEQKSISITLESNKVAHQIFSIDVKTQKKGGASSTYTVKVWHFPTFEVKKLYDTNNTLIADEWKEKAGKPVIQHYNNSERDSYTLIKDAWKFEFTVKAFEALTKNSDSINLQAKDNIYILASDVSRKDFGTNIIKASIALNKNNHHLIEQILLVQTSDSQIYEYRFKEINYEPLNADSISSEVFETIPKQMDISEWSKSVSPTNIPLTTNLKLSVGEVSDLKVDILYNLELINSNVGNTDVHITPDGIISIDSIVDTSQRKEETLSALSFIKNHPAVKINIDSDEEAANVIKRTPKTYASKQLRTAKDQDSSIQQILDDYFAKKLKTDNVSEIDRAKTNYVFRIMQNSRNLLSHAWALRRIVGGFSSEQLHSLSPEARLKWVEMANKHISKYRALLSDVEDDFAIVGVKRIDIRIKANTYSSLDISNGEILHKSVIQLFNLSLKLFHTTNSAFTEDIKTDFQSTFAPTLIETSKIVDMLDASFK